MQSEGERVGLGEDLGAGGGGRGGAEEAAKGGWTGEEIEESGWRVTTHVWTGMTAQVEQPSTYTWRELNKKTGKC